MPEHVLMRHVRFYGLLRDTSWWPGRVGVVASRPRGQLSLRPGGELRESLGR